MLFVQHLHPVVLHCTTNQSSRSSLRVVSFDRQCMVSSKFSIGQLSLRGLEIFDFKKYYDLENRIRGLSRSLEMLPCDRVHTTSYWCSIVTMALSVVVYEIFDVEK